jgi:uncharacterized protein
MSFENSSVSRIRIAIEVNGIGNFDCEFVRHLSPLTIATILRKVPITGLLHTRGTSMKYVETGLNIGAEKQRAVFEKGDLAYMTSNGSICIIMESTSGIMMNPLGKFLGDMYSFGSARPGSVLTIDRGKKVV